MYHCQHNTAQFAKLHNNPQEYNRYKDSANTLLGLQQRAELDQARLNASFATGNLKGAEVYRNVSSMARGNMLAPAVQEYGFITQEDPVFKAMHDAVRNGTFDARNFEREVGLEGAYQV